MTTSKITYNNATGQVVPDAPASGSSMVNVEPAEQQAGISPLSVPFFVLSDPQ